MTRSIVLICYTVLMPSIQCYWCQTVFYTRPSYVTGRKHKFCSQKCNHAWRSSPENTFWKNVTKTDTCWFWVGPIHKDTGYGAAHGNKLAHRLSYEIHKGPIPIGSKVLHSCHMRCCVNPHHLRLGTTQDNSDDMVSAGRSLVGSRNNKAKLSESLIPLIIKLRGLGVSPYKIAEILDVSYSTIRSVVAGKSWRHVAP